MTSVMLPQITPQSSTMHGCGWRYHRNGRVYRPRVVHSSSQDFSMLNAEVCHHHIWASVLSVLFCFINIKIHTVGNGCERWNITKYIYLRCTTTTTTTTGTMTTATNNDRSLCIQVSQLRTYNVTEKHVSIITHICFNNCHVSQVHKNKQGTKLTRQPKQAITAAKCFNHSHLI